MSFLSPPVLFRQSIVLVVFLIGCAGAFLGNFSLLAQSDGTTSDGSALRLNGAGFVPYSRPRPGRFFTAQVRVSNVSKTEQSGLVIARIERDAGFQSVTEFTVGPGEATSVKIHLRVPSDMPTDGAVPVSLSLNSKSAGNRILTGPNGQPLIDNARFPMESKRFVTGLILEPQPPTSPEWLYPKDDLLMSYELLAAANVDADMTRQMLTMDEGNLPCEMIHWASLDGVVIGKPGVIHDAAAMKSMMEWVESGGRVWILFDRIQETNLDRLLPAGMSCRWLDDVQINDFVVNLETLIPMKEDERTVHSTKPFRMRRVAQTGGEVSHTIDGYPAAFTYNIGRGSILVTTLDAEAWLVPRTQTGNVPFEKTSIFQMRNWARPLTDRFLSYSDPRTPLELADVHYPMKWIGNPVLDRNFVMSCVFGFCIALLVLTVLCFYTGNLTKMGWITPLLSIACCAPLLWATSQLRKGTPDTSANLQVIEVSPGSKTIQARQWTATFRTDVSQAKLDGNGDTQLDWQMGTEQSDLRQLHWKDFQQWQTTSSGWPSGIWKMNSRFSISPRPLDIYAKLDRNGLTLQLPEAMDEPLEDAVLMYTPGNPNLCGKVEPKATLNVPFVNTTIDESWIASAIVTDEQSRRDEVYHQSIARGMQMAFPGYPALMGWTRLWPSALKWDDERREQGAALVVLPVHLLPVQSGEEIVVPASLIRIQPIIEKSLSTAFSNRSGLWRDATSVPQSVPLRFSLPVQTLPLQSTQIDLEIQLRAAQRDVRISSRSPSEKTIAELSSPVGQHRFQITDSAILEDANDGQLDLVIDIGEDKGGSFSSAGLWQVDFIRMSIKGVVKDRKLN